MAFVGPHHGPKILGKNHQSTTKVTLNEPLINKPDLPMKPMQHSVNKMWNKRFDMLTKFQLSIFTTHTQCVREGNVRVPTFFR